MFGVQGENSFIQLPDGHKIVMIRENGTMDLNATLVDRRNMKCDLVAPVVPIAVLVSSEAGDEEMRHSRNVSESEAAHIPVLGGAREVNRSKQPTESSRRRHDLSHLPHVPWCTICCRARTIDDAHHVVILEESVDSLPKIVCEIMMKGDTTPMSVLLVVDSSTGYLGATDVGQKGGSSGFVAKWTAKWLEATGYARMKVQSDAEQSIEHLLKAVKSICTADLIVQRAPVKSHQSQGHVERAVRLVENQYRALLFDVQERTRVEIDPISAASARILRHSVWLLNRYQPHKGGSDIIRTSPRKSENLEEFSWLRQEHHEHFDQCGLVAQRTATNISLWTRLDMSYVQEQYDDAWTTRTVVQTSSSSMHLLRISKPDGDDVEVRERWTPTPGCRACESAHANKHLVRCEARRYEYRLKIRTKSTCDNAWSVP